MALGGFAPLPLRLGGSVEEGVTTQQWLRLVADLVAVRRTQPYCVIGIDQNSNVPAVTSYRGQNGVGVNDRPTLSWDGAWTVITFSNSYQDDNKTIVPMRVLGAKGTLSSTSGRVLVDDILSPRVIRVAPVDFTGANLSTAEFVVVVR